MVGQDSTEQQDKGEEDAEIGHGEICRPREMQLWSGTMEHGGTVLGDPTATLRSHLVSGPGNPHHPRLPLDRNSGHVWVLGNPCLASQPWP